MRTVGSPYTVALLYRRVSTEEQATEGLSLAAQQYDIRNYAARRHWTIGAEFADVLSGTRDDRPAYQRTSRLMRAVAEA
jgi:DNA invertase Pin-like site-specific DNA recombinase